MTSSESTSVRQQTESFVKSVWAKLLRRDCIDLSSDFFALGGSSMLAIEMLVQIEAHYRKLGGTRELDYTVFFEEATMSRLCGLLAVPAAAAE